MEIFRKRDWYCVEVDGKVKKFKTYEEASLHIVKEEPVSQENEDFGDEE